MKSFSLLLTLTVIFASTFAHSDRRNNFVTKGIKGAAAAAAPVLKAAAITGAKAAGNAVLSAAKAKLNKRRLMSRANAAAFRKIAHFKPLKVNKRRMLSN